MDEAHLRAVIMDSLLPMLGAELLPAPRQSTKREKLAAYLEGSQQIALKAERADLYRLVIRRSQDFNTDELGLAATFMEELGGAVSAQPERYRQPLLDTLPTRVVVRVLGNSVGIQSTLRRLEEWSSQTYEGHRITAAIGVSREGAGSGPLLEDYFAEPYAPVLSNGFDTMLAVTTDARVRRFLQLDSGDNPERAPYRLRQVAAWSKEGGLGVVLNLHGEILVFSNGALRFARRRGRWIHYVHDSVLAKMHPPRDPVLRGALWQSCLDASYARSGACIGVADQKSSREVLSLVDDGDRPGSGQGFKSTLFADLRGKLFPSLDRRHRQEILAMDGALVLDFQGAIVALGAIVEVKAGSRGGGRLLAAQTLSRFGLGIKVSADGPIIGFRHEAEVFRA